MKNVVTDVGYKVFYSYFLMQKEYDFLGERTSEGCPSKTNRQVAAEQAKEAVQKGLKHAMKYHLEKQFNDWVEADIAYFEHCLKASALDEDGERLQADRMLKSHELELGLLRAGALEWEE